MSEKNLRKYNPGVYASGNSFEIHLRPFVLIAYIFGFIKNSQLMEYTKDKCIDQQHQDVFQWD